MNIVSNRNVRRSLFLTVCLSTLVLGEIGGQHSVRAEDVAPKTLEKPPPEAVTPDEKGGGAKIDPDRFQEVDDAARLMVWLVVVCGLGAVALLTLIVIGARRLRRLTRSPSLKSKYDELEYLRAKYRHEVEGLDTPPPPSREIRR